jgi:hypothetical protein
MEKNKVLLQGLEYALQIETLVGAFSQAKANEFISAPEVKSILSDILKATGLKETSKKSSEFVKKEEVKGVK